MKSPRRLHDSRRTAIARPPLGRYLNVLADLPVPKPSSKDDILPPRSDKKPVDTVLATGLYLRNYNDGSYLPLEALQEAPNRLDPPFPSGVQICYQMYWENLMSDHLPGPQTFSRSTTYKKGITSSSSTTLSEELGVSYDGLSGRLSESFGHTITIMEETDVTITYAVAVPQGSVSVWTLWQLVEEFIFLDSAGKELDYSTTAYLHVGSGANFTVPFSLQNGFVNRTPTVYADQVLFPSARKVNKA